MSQPVNPDCDVAIVGYGPVGQALAIALAQRGHRVAVVERWPSLYPLPRAVTFDHECARILQSLGVMEALGPLTTTSPLYEWRNATGQVLKSFPGMDAPSISGWPQGTVFSQPDLERVLDARVRSFGEQVQLLQSHEVRQVRQDATSVTLVAHDTRETAAPGVQLRARYLVGCDGAGSFVREAMGSTYEDLGFSADWLVVDLIPKDAALWNRELVQLCDPARPTTNVCGGPGRRRFEFMLLAGETKDEMNNVEAAWRLLDAHGWHAGNATLERHAVYTFRGCVASEWRKGRMLIAGDAAHLMPPFAGQGLCAGLRDTAALAWRLHLVLRGLANDAVFDSYQSERGGHVRRIIDFSIMLGGVICILDPQAAAGRDAFLLGPGKEEEDRFPDTGLATSSSMRPGDDQAGQLTPQGRVQFDGRSGLFDDVVGRGHILLGLDHDPAALLSPAQQAFLDRIGARSVGIGPSMPCTDLDGVYRDWFTQSGVRCALVRPDYYLFGAAEAGELVDALRAAL